MNEVTDVRVQLWGDLLMDLLFVVFRFNMFDHRFFGITETEADQIDPQQKLLLQCTYRTLEDAGISMESISGSRTGVYIGNGNHLAPSHNL